ncbi:MAG: helix-turn-helix domain-containing protein, partial [Nitrospinota bacterium]
AEKSGVSPAGVYKIETNGMTPTITTLMKLANALEKRVSYFIEQEDSRAEVEFIPRDGRRVILKNEMGTNERIAGTLKGAKLDGSYKIIEPGSRSGSCVSSKAGEALVYCLRGELDFEVQGKSYHLREGDVIHHKTDLPHSWQNRGMTAAHILTVSTPPLES